MPATSSRRPVIAITPWRRTLNTWVHPESDLYTLNPDYVAGVEQAGGIAVIIPHVSDDAAAHDLLSRFDGLIVSGGADVDPSFYAAPNTHSMRPDPVADRSDIALTRAAAQLDRPLLAICRGAQVMNVAFGGTLHQHIWDDNPDHPAKPSTGDATTDAEAFLEFRHDVALTAGSLAAKIFDTEVIAANSLHHQSIDQPGTGIIVTGTAPDGIVEVVEHENHRMIGVQWHPERLTGEGHQPLFDWLVGACSAEH